MPTQKQIKARIELARKRIHENIAECNHEMAKQFNADIENDKQEIKDRKAN